MEIITNSAMYINSMRCAKKKRDRNCEMNSNSESNDDDGDKSSNCLQYTKWCYVVPIRRVRE